MFTNKYDNQPLSEEDVKGRMMLAMEVLATPSITAEVMSLANKLLFDGMKSLQLKDEAPINLDGFLNPGNFKL